MIGRLLAALRDLRIQHHHRVAHAAGCATLAAQINRDWPGAAAAMARMHAAQEKRDRLLAKQQRNARRTADLERFRETRDELRDWSRGLR